MDIVNYILGNRYKGSGGYDKTTTLSWDGVLTDDEKTFGPYDFDEEQLYFYKISDEPLSSDAFRNSITTIVLTKTGEIRSSDAAKDHCIIGTDDELLMNICAMTLNVFIEKDMFKRGLFISKIIKKSDDNDAIYVKSISYKTPIPIQNKFIPLAEDGVKGGIVGTAKTDDMLTPVGIDENGKLFAESQFYDTRDTKDLVMTFDGNLDGKEYIETEPGTYLVKYSDYVPPYDSVNYIHTTFASNGSEQTGNLTKDNLFYMSDDNLIAYGINGGALNFIYSGSMTIGDKTMTQGAWVAHVKSDDVTNIYKEITINYNVGELKQIDKKYIPEQKPLTFTGAATGTYDGSEAVEVNIPEGGGSEPVIIFDSGEITEEVNIFGPIDISGYKEIRIFGKAYPSENSAGIRPAQLLFQDNNKRILCNAGNNKLFGTSGNPVSFLIYLSVGANAISTNSYSGFNAGNTFGDTDYAISSGAILPDGGALIYSTKFDLSKMRISAQDDLTGRPFGIGTRIMVIGDR